jgi:Na+/H+ antiporter NhaD/arsenite permease-like protein
VSRRTGVFQWLAVVAYRQAGGNTWRLVVLLMIATVFLSVCFETFLLYMLPASIVAMIGLVIMTRILTASSYFPQYS